ncbi:hypothetical protein LL912_21690 [Niabella sp. CC-SYL272]|uniref:hypothetical protein n=1 Tax=Niabella agricola TaxID=2891571 RepID=UPI001F425AA4|nr:hypothetical protein [Niabella agricola]MCF3111414.1 hypothetical protein [Niabella agricola]
MDLDIIVSGTNDKENLLYVNNIAWSRSFRSIIRFIIGFGLLGIMFLTMGLRSGYDLKSLQNDAQVVNNYNFSFWIGLGCAMILVALYILFIQLRKRKKMQKRLQSQLNKLDGIYKVTVNNEYYLYENKISCRRIVWRGFDSFVISGDYVILFGMSSTVGNFEYINTTSLSQIEKLKLGELLGDNLRQIH